MTDLTSTSAAPSTTTDKVLENLEVKAKSASSYIVALMTAGAAWWFGLAPAEQTHYLTQYGLLSLAPYLGGIAWIVAALWPQTITTAAQRKVLLDQAVAWIGARLAAGASPVIAPPAPAGSTAADVQKAVDKATSTVSVTPLAPSLGADSPLVVLGPEKTASEAPKVDPAPIPAGIADSSLVDALVNPATPFVSVLTPSPSVQVAAQLQAVTEPEKVLQALRTLFPQLNNAQLLDAITRAMGGQA